MTETESGCAMRCWLAAAAVGLFVVLLAFGAGGRALLEALAFGALTCGLLGLLFTWLFCAPVPKAQSGQAAQERIAQAKAAERAAAAEARAAEEKAAAEVAEKEAAERAAADRAAAEKAEAEKAAAAAKEAEAKAAEEKAAAERAAAEEAAKAAAAEAKAAEEKAAADAQAAEASAPSTSANVGSTLLAGEEELASRKGSWRYDSGDSGSGDPAPSPASEDNVDRDGDGVVEGSAEGSKPSMLSEARDGAADNLKEIKGIGPKLEQLCNSLGIYHFDQIAGWSADELAWIDANLTGFKGRATRDDWVGQAKILASGGETEFSQRVEDGKVY
jgi:predicted flap endonuclease-1-like 5' DNA nuclease